MRDTVSGERKPGTIVYSYGLLSTFAARSLSIFKCAMGRPVLLSWPQVPIARGVFNQSSKHVRAAAPPPLDLGRDQMGRIERRVVPCRQRVDLRRQGPRRSLRPQGLVKAAKFGR